MSWDHETVRTAIAVASMIGAIAAAVYSWWAARNKTTRAAIDQVQGRVEDVESRIQSVETDLRHMPTQSDIKDLASQIAGVRADMKEISGTLQGVGRAVDLMNQYLLDAGRSRE